jgi:asparagine synthase (glutamine-hydrolysing)
MPGVIGLITNKPREWAESQLLRMVEALRHESFYVTGTWIDEPLGVYVGWVAQKGSFSGGMPLCNERGDVVLVFSGEEFPEPGTAHRLKERGHVLDVEGPSYLVHLYEEDPSFPEGLNGKFHGLLIDRARATAMLFNDRYGLHRVYFHESNDAFYFASEAKAILAVRPSCRTVDLQGMGEFIACGCVLENRTLFAGIQLLPAASAWIFRRGSLERKNSYFHTREWEDQVPLEPESFYQQLREVFTRNLPRYTQGREQIGISLTGGVDTRIIMAWQRFGAGSLPCYTFGGMYRDCRDVKIARQVADICRQSHEVITVGKEFLSRFPSYAERSVLFSDGCVNVSRASDLYVSEKARGIAPVKLVGSYGSEIIRHAVMFKPVMPVAGLFRPEFVSCIRQSEATYAGLRREHPVTFAAFRQSSWSHYGVLSLEESQLTVRSPYLDNDFVRTMYRAPKSNGADSDVRLRLVHDGNPALAQVRYDMGQEGDSGGMFGGLSRRFLEFTHKAEYAYDYGMPQWVARIDHSFSALHFERLFLGRHKFAHYRIWYRDALSGYVREMLLDPRTLSRPYLQRNMLESIVRDHLRGDRNYTTEIDGLLTLELLHRLFLDS